MFREGLVPGTGIEPVRQKAADFKSATSTNFVTRATFGRAPILHEISCFADPILPEHYLWTGYQRNPRVVCLCNNIVTESVNLCLNTRLL